MTRRPGIRAADSEHLVLDPSQRDVVQPDAGLVAELGRRWHAWVILDAVPEVTRDETEVVRVLHQKRSDDGVPSRSTRCMTDP